MDDDLTRLLTRAAEVGGRSTAPDPRGLVRRAGRRERARRTGAVAAVLLAVLALVVPVGLYAARDRTAPQPAASALGTADALAAGHWEDLPPAPIAPRTSPAYAWTGSQLLVYGGYTLGSTSSTFVNDGAAYDPATRTWQTLPAAPFPVAGAASVWTGDRWVMVSGNAAASYDPFAGSWTMLASLPYPLFAQSVAWAGGQLVVTTYHETYGLVRYDPVAGKWRRLPDPPLAEGRTLSTLAAAGQGDGLTVVLTTVDDGVAPQTQVLSLDVGSETWTELPAAGQGRVDATDLVPAADALYVPAGQGSCIPNNASCPYSVVPTYRFSGGVWTKLPISDREQPSVASAWTGSALVSLAPDAQVLDPAAGWTALPPGMPEAADVAVWTGDQLLVWVPRRAPRRRRALLDSPRGPWSRRIPTRCRSTCCRWTGCSPRSAAPAPRCRSSPTSPAQRRPTPPRPAPCVTSSRRASRAATSPRRTAGW